MEGSWQQHARGGASQNNGYPDRSNGPGRRLRMPTVHEVLPYTPLSSIVPFSPNIVPPPVAMPTPAPTAFSDVEEVKNAKKLLKELSAGANNAETASQRCQQTLQDVQKLLNPDTLTQYKFKSRKSRTSGDANASNGTSTSTKLSPFARMVFETTNIHYRYPTPTSPEPHNKCVASVVIPQARLKTENETNGYSAPQPQRQTPSSGTSKVQVLVPGTLTPAQRAEYQYVNVADSSVGAHHESPSARRDTVAGSRTKNINPEQQQRGDQAVHNLRNLLSQVFEAEDQLQLDTSGIVSNNANTIFIADENSDISGSILQRNVQNALESCIAKASAAGRLQDLEIDHLLHVQKLCEGAVTAVEPLALYVGEDWSEGDVEEWLSRLSIAEHGLVAARTLMRIMAGGSHQKELQSEDFLRVTLDALKAVIEGCLVPIVEEPAFSGERIRGDKAGQPQSFKFTVASSNRKAVLSLLNAATKGMKLLGDLLVKTDFDETALSQVEYLCKILIFAENAGNEKESALGIQNFESMRLVAMDVLARIFTKYVEQRSYIFDEILVSLEKLPATKQSARQYRPQDTKPIQLVSALLMRLVQTSATRSKQTLKLRMDDAEDADAEDISDEESDNHMSDDEDSIRVSTPKKKRACGQDLASLSKPLHDAAQSNAIYIINSLVRRAITTSKSSDEPYRKLLDIFTEDFLNVLGSSDWPAAELLLRVLATQMIAIIEKESSSAPARCLALELLGTMGSGILELQMKARHAGRSIDASESIVSQRLRGMVGQLEAGNLDTRAALAFDGPHRVLIQYLEAMTTGENALLQTARGYHLMQWATSIAGEREGSTDSDTSDTPRSSKDLQSKLMNMFHDPQWLEEHTDRTFDHLSTPEGRMAAMVVTLSSKFCRAFNRIFSILLSTMSSESSSSTVKSRSLKSVVTLLEKDATILERNSYVLTHIFRCATDSSSLVRDSALGLIDKCISLQPDLSSKVYRQIIERTNDAAVGVRKRAMKMLKDIYVRNKATDVRSAIANAIIARIEDTEDSVNELARVIMEEIWFHSFYGLKLDGERAVPTKLAYAAQVALFIETVERSDDVLKVLEALLKRLLSTSKTAEANVKVCRTLITVLFDGIVDNSEIPGSPDQVEILRSLTVFARACPALFTATQLERLEPYTQNLGTSDDLDLFRSVITILRHVVPHQPMMSKTALTAMRRELLKNITKLQKAELNEVAPCLWTMSTIINDTYPLSRTMISVLQKINSSRNTDFATVEQRFETIVTRLITIAGEFGNACDFGAFLSDFKDQCNWSQEDSVPAIIVETICSFTSPKRPLPVRIAAVQAICTVCQAWPKQFLRADVTNAFETLFKDRVPSLEEAILTGLEYFFVAQEVPDETIDVPELGSGIASGTERLGRTYVASDQDGASTSMAQRFLQQILRLALSSCDEPAFVAARLVVSINKQGLVHPKESGPALVALETCPNKLVANLAFREHLAQHQKHETLFEKEYMRAVQRAFEYQLSVIGDSAGFVGYPAVSKMHLTWEVLKKGKASVRKKFLGNMAQKLDFDPSAIDSSVAAPQHWLFVNFCVENLAFFDYDKVDDLLHLLSSLDKTFAATGSTVAQAIESEVLNLDVGTLKSDDTVTVNGASETAVIETSRKEIHPGRLRQLALSAQILTLIWETRSFLHKLWNMQKHKAKAKQAAKDVNKAPNRATNAPALTDVYLKRMAGLLAALNSQENYHQMCSSFLELISVDNEVKLGSEDLDAELADDYDTPSEGRSAKSPSLPPSGGGRGRKRKSSVSVGGTPRKKGRPSLGKRKSTSNKYAEDDEDDEGGWD